MVKLKSALIHTSHHIQMHLESNLSTILSWFRYSLSKIHLSFYSRVQDQVVQIIVVLVQLLQIVHIKYSSPLFSGVFTPN